MGIRKGLLLYTHHGLQCQTSHLRAVLRLDTWQVSNWEPKGRALSVSSSQVMGPYCTIGCVCLGYRKLYVITKQHL